MLDRFSSLRRKNFASKAKSCGLLAEGFDAPRSAQQQQISRAGSKEPIGDNTHNVVDLTFEFYRIGDLHVEHVEDDIAVVCHHALTVNRVTAQFDQLAGHVAAGHGNHFYRQRECTQHRHQLAGIRDADKCFGHRRNDLLAGQSCAPAFDQIQVLVANLIEAYRQSITGLAWMTKETQGRALEKLGKFTPKIGYPVKWRDYSTLQTSATDLIGNVRASSEFEFQRELGKIGKPLDRDEWFMTPQTINAYYNPGFNEIVFPAAILQFPFFDENRDAAANYGAIGAVIGHEIGHGFDDQGSKYDGDGRLTDWWTADDRAAFEKLTGSLIEQYNALAPRQVPEHHVNGALTIGENIGDLGGLGIAWKAYLISLTSTGSARAVGEEPPVIDGMSGAERFFLSWAQTWQLKARDEEVIRLLAIDPHSPNEFRCNQIVRNLDGFYETFGVSEADELWLNPEERVTIW